MDDLSELPGIYNLKQFVLILVSKNLKLKTRVIRSRVVESKILKVISELIKVYIKLHESSKSSWDPGMT